MIAEQWWKDREIVSSRKEPPCEFMILSQDDRATIEAEMKRLADQVQEIVKTFQKEVESCGKMIQSLEAELAQARKDHAAERNRRW